MPAAPSNEELAEILERIADLLDAQDANPHRVRAYRTAARNIRDQGEALAALLERGGRAALEALPGIGKTIAAQLEEVLHSRRLGFLERLEGQIAPEDLFTTIPGIGEALAQRIHRELRIDTLEELELAAHDGRLAALPGFGRRRVKAICDSLAAVLGRSARRHARRLRWLERGAGAPAGAAPTGTRPGRPDVATLLAVDAEYRRRAEAGELRRIAPRRFNPDGAAWLPVLHVEKEGWSFTALYSNTARAHELGTTHDWVVIYFERDGEEDQCTVVTEHSGPLRGRRVVRGREAECIGREGAPAARTGGAGEPNSSS
jgi:DNA polymerase (family 10)